MYCYVEPRTDPDDHAMLDGRLRTSVSITGRGSSAPLLKTCYETLTNLTKRPRLGRLLSSDFALLLLIYVGPLPTSVLFMHPIISTSVADIAGSGGILEFNFLGESAQSS